jgi:hypothetical protein
MHELSTNEYYKQLNFVVIGSRAGKCTRGPVTDSRQQSRALLRQQRGSPLSMQSELPHHNPSSTRS